MKCRGFWETGREALSNTSLIFTTLLAPPIQQTSIGTKWGSILKKLAFIYSSNISERLFLSDTSLWFLCELLNFKPTSRFPLSLWLWHDKHSSARRTNVSQEHSKHRNMLIHATISTSSDTDARFFGSHWVLHDDTWKHSLPAGQQLQRTWKFLAHEWAQSVHTCAADSELTMRANGK